MKKIFKNPFILIAMIAVGIAFAVVNVKSRKQLEHADEGLEPRSVQVMQVQKIPFAARVTAYGTVEPAVVLQSRAEVSGEVSYVHPELKQGGSLPAGTVVLRIDPEDYQVSLKQTQADLAASESEMAQLLEEEKSTQRSFRLASENLSVGEAELKRIRDVFEKGGVSRSQLDSEEQQVIQLRQTVEDLQGKLNTYASRKASVTARIERAREQVKGGETTLGRTEVSLPFNARIGEVQVDKGEFVSVGNILFEAQDVKGVEINAQLPVTHMRKLVASLQQFENGDKMNVQMHNMQAILESMNLRAHVHLVGGMPGAVWEGRVVRFSESIDPTRRTLGVVVAVDNPYEQIIPGERPPLLKGMYTAIELVAPLRNAIVVPLKAIHQGRIYIADADNELEIRQVGVQVQQGDIALVGEGLAEGEHIVINDLVPVIEGMPLRPVADESFAEQFRNLANGTKH